MKVILTHDVPNLGSIGDIVQVKDGFARNYLLPRSLAAVANEANKAQLAHQKRVLDNKREKALAAAKQLAHQIEKVSVTVVKQVGEDERIFGSVTTGELEELLKSEGIDVSKKEISLLEEVKKVGVYTAQVKLHKDIVAKFKVWVVAQN